MIVLSCMLAGGVIGFWIGCVYSAQTLESKEAKLRAGADEAWEEVKRLRAQVALHIGKDK